MKHRKPYDQMTAAELAEATKEFDKEFVGIPGRPLTAKQKAEERRARRGRGRPRIGLGAERINISVERGLLRLADRMAEREGISRAELVARGLRLVVSERRAG